MDEECLLKAYEARTDALSSLKAATSAAGEIDATSPSPSVAPEPPQPPSANEVAAPPIAPTATLPPQKIVETPAPVQQAPAVPAARPVRPATAPVDSTALQESFVDRYGSFWLDGFLALILTLAIGIPLHMLGRRSKAGTAKVEHVPAPVKAKGASMNVGFLAWYAVLFMCSIGLVNVARQQLYEYSRTPAQAARDRQQAEAADRLTKQRIATEAAQGAASATRSTSARTQPAQVSKYAKARA